MEVNRIIARATIFTAHKQACINMTQVFKPFFKWVDCSFLRTFWKTWNIRSDRELINILIGEGYPWRNLEPSTTDFCYIIWLLYSIMHPTDTAPRERNAKHIKVQNTIDVHLKTFKSLIIITKEVSPILTRTSKCASAHCKRTKPIESLSKQIIICKTLISSFKLHMSI